MLTRCVYSVSSRSSLPSVPFCGRICRTSESTDADHAAQVLIERRIVEQLREAAVRRLRGVSTSAFVRASVPFSSSYSERFVSSWPIVPSPRTMPPVMPAQVLRELRPCR